MSDWPETLRTAMADGGWSVRRLARELGVTRGAIGHWLRPRSVPSPAAAVRVREVLGIEAPERLACRPTTRDDSGGQS